MAEFCRRLGIHYDSLRTRIVNGRDLFAPIKVTRARAASSVGKKEGYTLEELADMYCQFRDDEFALDILADFSGLERGSGAVVRLEREIQNYLENLRREVNGK